MGVVIDGQRKVVSLHDLSAGDQLVVFKKQKSLCILGVGSEVLLVDGLTPPKKVYNSIFSDISPFSGLFRLIIWKKYRLMTDVFVDDEDHFILNIISE